MGCVPAQRCMCIAATRSPRPVTTASDICCLRRACFCCAVLCCALLQFYDAATKEYTIQILSDKQVIKHTLEHTLWRMARRSDAGSGPAAAAAGKGPEREGLVGQRIEVWWPAEKEYFAGKVTVRVISLSYPWGFGCKLGHAC